ncbi:MAG: phosphoribosylaminoimidazolesuccinocarboxamide synthase, partial [Candidatus Diapherotrites archaeon]|nr:phosphoribosylaminoimidazolesuccinocarboxamide synthase [Candidatus Diapherotrites archaeon]
HMISVPHPNILLARQAVRVLPVEVVVRGYMAKSATPTSVYHNYAELGRREIYGLRFPDGLRANERFPAGPILTPTTKAVDGHDKELTDAQAREAVDGLAGEGVWGQAKTAALGLFERASAHCMKQGAILTDTKFEFGMDSDGQLMLIDEALTPECSRFWLRDTYAQRLREGKDPDPPKDVLVEWLEKKGFDAKGNIPEIDQQVIDTLLEAYAIPYRRITKSELPVPISDPKAVAKAALDCLSEFD